MNPSLDKNQSFSLTYLGRVDAERLLRECVDGPPGQRERRLAGAALDGDPPRGAHLAPNVPLLICMRIFVK